MRCGPLRCGAVLEWWRRTDGHRAPVTTAGSTAPHRCVRTGAAGPVGGVHRLLPRRLHPTRAPPAWEPVPIHTSRLPTSISPAASTFESSGRTGPTLTRASPIIVHAPGVRGDRPDPAVDRVRGQFPAHPRLLDGDLGRDGHTVGRAAEPGEAFRRRYRPWWPPIILRPKQTVAQADPRRCRSGGWFR